MARRATSLSSSLVVVLLVAAATIAATHEARADAGIKKGGVCRYDNADAQAAFKKRDYRHAAELFTKAINWIEQNCKGPGSSQVELLNNSKSGLWDDYKLRAASYTGLKEYGKAVHDLVTMDQATVVGFSKGELKTAFLACDGAVKSEPNNPFYRGARATAYQKWAHLVALEAKDDKLEARYLKTALADRDAQLKLVHSKEERAEVLAARADVYDVGGTSTFGPDAPQHALEDISTAIELDPKAAYYAERSKIQTDPTLALADIAKAIELRPKVGWYYEQRARYLGTRAELAKKAGKLDEAEKDYATLVKDDPKSVTRRIDHFFILVELGRDQEAEAERKLIEQLDPKALRNPFRVCQVANIRAKQADKGGAATPKDLTTAWTLGKLVALIPLQHLKGKPNEKADEAWATVSNVVRAREKATGKEPHGLDPIPEFKGPKTVQVRQAIAFIFQQRKKVEAILTAGIGSRAGAVFALSSAGFMALGLNTMGVPNLNHQLGEIIEKEAPLSGLPCHIWVDTAIKATTHAKPADVTAAWDKTDKEAKAFLSKS